MKCIVLAAGASTRIRSISDDLPKCLIPVGGKPILQRIIENLLAGEVRHIGLVLGFKSHDIRAFLKERFPFENIKFAVNPKFETTNNAFSLLMAREFYRGQKGTPPQKLLVLDSDIVFSPKLLPFLLERVETDGLAARVEGEHNDEEIKVTVDSQKNVLRIGKDIRLADAYGESIGIELFSPDTADNLFRVLERRVKEGPGRSEFYEASFQELIDAGAKIQAVDVSKFPAAEVDTPEDLEHVEKQIIPLIDQSS